MRVRPAIAALAITLTLAACQSGGLQYPGEGYGSSDVQASAPEPYIAGPKADEALPPVMAEAAPAEVIPYMDASAGIMDEQEAELRRGFEQPGVMIDRDGGNVVLDLNGDMLFEYESAVLTPRGRELLLSLTEVFKRYPGTYIDVDGFSETSPRMLSQERADAVVLLMEDAGVRSQRLSALGHADNPDGAIPKLSITLEPAAG